MSHQFDDQPVGSRVLFENEWVRVWEIEVEPGQTLAMHNHQLNYVTVALDEGDVEVQELNGTLHRNHRRPGDIQVTEVGSGQIHELRNLGQHVYRNRLVEFKAR